MHGLIGIFMLSLNPPSLSNLFLFCLNLISQVPEKKKSKAGDVCFPSLLLVLMAYNLLSVRILLLYQ